ncbi:hypothetical protein GCM10022235_80160 [Kribbella ginsengisoli]|uniref:Uncharacterized protein n=1 Tax=Kribbella ginsengisoli TaxID=363865 RepID=A0ABP6Z6D1_9ACTN
MYVAMYARCIRAGHRGLRYRGEGRPGGDELTVAVPGPEFGTDVRTLSTGLVGALAGGRLSALSDRWWPVTDHR